jgi:hypothetical protein
MDTSLARAGLWKETMHSEALKRILNEFQCNMSKQPKPYPRVSLSASSGGEELCIDIIYFEGFPQLHAEDKYSGFSAGSRLKSRAISDQIRTLSTMWTDIYKKPKRLIAAAEYDKSQFRAYYDSMDCELVIVETEARHQNGTIEAGK